MKYFLLIFFIFLGFTGCQYPVESGRYHSPNDDFSIEFPEGWQRIKTEKKLVLVRNPSKEATLYVSLDISTRPTDLQQDVQITLAAMRKRYNAPHVETTERVMIGGHEAIKVIGSPTDKEIMKYVSYFILIDSTKFYSITGLAKAEDFLWYKFLFEQAAESIQFLQ